MKKPTYSPYATMRLGRIEKPRATDKDEPKGTVLRSEVDLRVKRTDRKGR